LLLFAVNGQDGLLLRHLPVLSKAQQWNKLRGLLSFSTLWVLSLSVVMGLAMWLVAKATSESLPTGALEAFGIGAMIFPIFALANLRQAVLRALKRAWQAELVDSTLRPITLIAVLALVVWWTGITSTASTALWAQLAASLLAMVAGAVLIARALPEEALHIGVCFEIRSWLLQALPFLAIAGANAISRQVGTIMLGSMSTIQETGVYAAMLRIADFLLFGTYTISAIIAPIIAEQFREKQSEALQKAVTLATWMSFTTAFAGALIIVALGKWLTSIYGPGFESGTRVLLILALARVLWAAFGFAGFAMTMTGHALMAARWYWVGAFVNLVGCVVLIPLYNAAGAAIAFLVGSVVAQVAIAIKARKITGLRCGLL
jgi:O-antigen/teichoic acid export membrane protein